MIITTEIKTDIENLNPGCIVTDLFGIECVSGNIFEYNKIGKVDLTEYRPIPSLDNCYEINENGTSIRNVVTGRQLKIFLDMHHSKIGYYATFINFKGIVRRVMIHIAVAEAWIGIKPNGLEVDHIDRNPHNNHYTNLRYVTHGEQMKNRILSPRIIEQGKKNTRKYIVEQVMKPVKVIYPDGNIREFESYTECAKNLAPLLNKSVDNVRKRIVGAHKAEYSGYKFIHVDECVKQIAT